MLENLLRTVSVQPFIYPGQGLVMLTYFFYRNLDVVDRATRRMSNGCGNSERCQRITGDFDRLTQKFVGMFEGKHDKCTDVIHSYTIYRHVRVSGFG